MDYELAVKIWHTIRRSALAELRDDMVELAIRYARLRVDSMLAVDERRAELDSQRRLCHNALIQSCDVLARNMTRQGEDGSWRAEIGDDRRVVGDFACHLHAILGISAR